MNKNLIVSDVLIISTSIAMAIIEEKNGKTPTIKKVLAELIKRSDCGHIGKPNLAATDIIKTLKINGSAYRQAIAKLKRMGLISKTKENSIIIHPMISPPFSQILLTEP